MLPDLNLCAQLFEHYCRNCQLDAQHASAHTLRHLPQRIVHHNLRLCCVREDAHCYRDLERHLPTMSKLELSTAVKNAVGELAIVPETRQTSGMLSKVHTTRACSLRDRCF